MPERAAQVVLAFDFGLRRIGIASGESVSGTAAPRGAIAVGAGGADWAAIERSVRDYRPQLLIVGAPFNADGTPGRLAPAADRFAAELAQRLALPVARINEYASSIEAAAQLKSARQSGQRRRRVQHADIDSAAAAIILERWFEEQGPHR